MSRAASLRLPGWSVGLLLSLFVAGPVSAGMFEKGGASGLGARAMGMAGAYTALAADETATWWNPAGLGESSVPRFSSSLDSLYDGKLRNLDLSAVCPLPSGAAAGLSWQHGYYPNAVEINTDVLDVAGSLPLTDDQHLRLGSGCKLIFGAVRADGGDFQGLGFDLGLRYLWPLDADRQSLAFALRVQDLDTRLHYGNGAVEQIPQSLAFGCAFRYDPATTAEMDMEYVHSDQAATTEARVLRLGAERWFQDLVGVRAGCLLDSRQSSAWTAGAGMKYAGWELEYALLGQISNLGLSHRISLSYGMPAFRWPEVAKAPPPAPTPPVVPSQLRVLLAAEPELFSPNQDGVADVMAFRVPILEGDRGRVATWRLSIMDSEQKEQGELSGIGFPDYTTWDGRVRGGGVLPDGRYRIRMVLSGRNHQKLAEAETSVTLRGHLPKLELEVTPAELVILGQHPEMVMTFRPQGGNEVPDLNWQLHLRPAAGGKPLRSFAGGGGLPAEIAWNGQNARKQLFAAGEYIAEFLAADSVGNQAQARRTFTVTRLPKEVTLAVSPHVLKAGDPNEGVAHFTLSAEPAAKIRDWELTVSDAESGRLVRSFTGAAKPPADLVWDGKDLKGLLIKSGHYFHALLTVTYSDGSSAKSPVRALATDVSLQDAGKALALHLTAIPFESGSNLVPLDSFKNLQQAAETIKRYAKHYRVQVKGFTDTQEAQGRELELSRERAQRVAEYLQVSGGLPPASMEVVGYGATIPLAPDTSDAGRAKNRRVEVVLIIYK